jgi:hypothetical protein
MVCASCGLSRTCAPGGLCHDVDAKGERVIDSGCYGAAEVDEGARLAALGVALGVPPARVNPATLAIAAKLAACEWYEVTPEKLAGKLTAARAAVAEVNP